MPGLNGMTVGWSRFDWYRVSRAQGSSLWAPDLATARSFEPIALPDIPDHLESGRDFLIKGR